MKIRNATYAKTPIATRLGTFVPDEHGVLDDVSDEAGRLLIAVAGFVALEQPRTPRALAPAPVEPSAPAQEPAGAPQEPVEAPQAPEPPASPQEPVEAPQQPAKRKKGR